MSSPFSSRIFACDARHARTPLTQQLLELEAQEAFVRLEEYKKAGVYAVLKRIEVWQSRGGQRLGDIFQGVSECVVFCFTTHSRPMFIFLSSGV